MESAMVIMQSVEEKNHKLVNCLGHIDYNRKDCNECPFIFPCMLTRRELKMNCYAKGKHRRGFGRTLPDKKSKYWTGDMDASW